ncbi:hypothetical protein GLAREA_03762 [Glarea lozoyensis ATCC 20868]|uniref:Uncharacterized protein n=1 Tax=Glarea lozoyensis (strain ATCC 20868 / MF5171) TaxID=1116229 RepID=S3CZ01_GLAL2|nr:uncharacterized protein GLAREA_03762 [Glarea lozoyensis ATCC 20868]EPE30795.1 hypothetical protein GLAREA_03762 [Glarea lozoyensis ATCC 20868]
MLPADLEQPRSVSAKPKANVSIREASAVPTGDLLAENASNVAQQRELPLDLDHHNTSSRPESRPSRLNFKKKTPRTTASTNQTSVTPSVDNTPSLIPNPNAPPLTPPHQVLDNEDLRTPPGAPKAGKDELQPWRMKQKKRSAPSEDDTSTSQEPKRRKVTRTMKSARHSADREKGL